LSPAEAEAKLKLPGHMLAPERVLLSTFTCW
jgi:hypothetical protein